VYERKIGLFGLLFVSIAFIGVAQLLLLDTLASYGEFFRSQMITLLFTPIFPTIAAIMYIFELGPMPQYNLLPLSLLPHMVLDTYALFNGGLFQFSPATRRVGERNAIDDLDSPVVTVDEHGHLVSANDAATKLLDHDTAEIIGDDLDRQLGVSIDLNESEQDVTIRADGKRRHYRVTSCSFRSARGGRLGYTIVFQDITDIIQREQRFAVVNRVLRHNLRNDLQVVSGHAELLNTHLDESQPTESADAIIDETKRLLGLAERARELDKTVGGVTVPDEPVALREIVDECASNVAATAPEATIEIEIPPTLKLYTDPSVLQLVVGNLLENAIEHNAAPTVTVSVRRTDRDSQSGSVWLGVEDDGSGIPDHELAAIRDGSETALKHGSGLGLWVIKSGITSLGGDVSFSTSSEDGTRVTVRIPGLVSKETETERSPDPESPIRT
jgi:nitrogen fixation/metabolism regulation signal transduction histidine kinase